MSQAPLSVYGHHVRAGTALGQNLQLQDTLWSALTDSYAQLPMGITAEKLADKFGITRADCDAYALRSQQAWVAAQKAGVYAHEVTPIEVKGKKGPEQMTVDEHPRPETTLESLQKLKPVFQKDDKGRVTAGTASGIGDGAASMVVASGEAVKLHKLQPMVRLVGWSVAGVDPSIMGIGPSPAIRALLAKTGISLDKIDLVEVNEAFAAQYLAVEKDLGLDRARSNRNGGAIALAHPLAMSGARITTHLTHQLVQNPGMKYAIGSACIGGGQGIALLLERV